MNMIVEYVETFVIKDAYAKTVCPQRLMWNASLPVSNTNPQGRGGAAG